MKRKKSPVSLEEEILTKLSENNTPSETTTPTKNHKRVKLSGYKNISFTASTPAVGNIGKYVSLYCYETRKFKSDFYIIHGFVNDFEKLMSNLKIIKDKTPLVEKLEKIKKNEKVKNKTVFYSGVEDYSIIKNNDIVIRFPIYIPSDINSDESSKKIENDGLFEHFYFKDELIKIISSVEVPAFGSVDVMNIISKYNPKKKMFFINSTNVQLSEISNKTPVPHEKYNILSKMIDKSATSVPFYDPIDFIRYNRIFCISTTKNLISEIELTKLYKKTNNTNNLSKELVSESKLFVGKFFVHKDVFLGVKNEKIEKIEGIIEIEFGLFGKGRIEEKFGIYEVNDYVNFLTSNSDLLNYYFILSVIKDKPTESIVGENIYEKSKFPPQSINGFKFLTRMSCFIEELVWDYKYFVTNLGINVDFSLFSSSLIDYLSKRKLVDDCTKNVPRLSLPENDFFILNYFSHEIEILKSKKSYYDFYIVPCQVKRSTICIYLDSEIKKTRDKIQSEFDKEKSDVENFIDNKKKFSIFNDKEYDIKGWVSDLSSQTDISVLFFCLRKNK